MLRLVPISSKLVGRSDDDGTALQRQRLRRLEPGPKRLFRKLEAGAIKKARPDFGRRERHDGVDNLEGGGAKLFRPCGKSNSWPRVVRRVSEATRYPTCSPLASCVLTYLTVSARFTSLYRSSA